MTEETTMILEQLQKINTRLERVDSRLDKVDVRLDKMDSRLDRMDVRLNKMDSRLDNVDTRLNRLDLRMEKLDTRQSLLESDMRELRLTVENELKSNISIIAEGHLDLNRKLDEALRGDSDREMMKLRLNVMEGDIRRLKKLAAKDT